MPSKVAPSKVALSKVALLKVAVAALVAGFLVAPAALAAQPPPGLEAVAAAHPGGTLSLAPPAEPVIGPKYVFGQAFCYSQPFQYVRGSGIARQGLFVRVVWCAVPGIAPHIYKLDTGYRYEICTGLIQCAGTQGPFLASGGIGSAWADYEYIGYYRWTASGITASSMLHLAFEVQENGPSWSYGWG